MNAIRMSLVIVLLAFSTGAFAQGSIPSGTILPIRLNSAISTKAHDGEIITGRVMQDVPLADGRRIREGAEVVGHVIAVHHADGGEGTQLSFAFDKLIVSKKTAHVITYLRAIASPVEVENAQLPETDLAQGLDLGQQNGVIVPVVRPGGSADQAGLRVQDILQSLDGQSIGSTPQAEMIIGTRTTDTKLQAVILRGTQKMNLNIPVVEDKNSLESAG